MAVNPTYNCDDCGRETDRMSPAAIAKSSVTRDPGDKLCSGCSSRRVLMVRELDRLPNDLPTIRSRRSISAIGAA